MGHFLPPSPMMKPFLENFSVGLPGATAGPLRGWKSASVRKEVRPSPYSHVSPCLTPLRGGAKGTTTQHLSRHQWDLSGYTTRWRDPSTSEGTRSEDKDMQPARQSLHIAMSRGPVALPLRGRSQPTTATSTPMPPTPTRNAMPNTPSFDELDTPQVQGGPPEETMPTTPGVATLPQFRTPQTLFSPGG